MKKLRELAASPAVIICMLIVAALGLFMIGHKNFSIDEMDTVFIIKDWHTLWQVLWLREGNMWLYYIVLHIWQVLGNSEAILRALSLVFSIATIPVAYLLGKLLFDTKIAQTSIILLAFNTFLIFNAQNARAYAMVLFITTLASYFLARYRLEGRRTFLIWAAVLNILAVYTHLYAAFVVAAQFVALILPLRKRLWTEILPIFAITGALVLPLFIAPSFHAQPLDWIPAPTLKNIAGTFVILAGDFVPLGALYLVFLAVLAAKIWPSLRKSVASPENWKYLYLVSWIIIPIVLALGYSIAIKPLYTSPYFFVCLVPFALLAAAGIQALRRPWLRRTAISLAIILAAVRLFGWYSGSYTITGALANNNESWGQTATYLTTHTTAGDAVLYSPSMERDKVDYYLTAQGQSLTATEITLKPYFLTTGRQVHTLDTGVLNTLPSSHHRVWIVIERVEGSEAIRDTDTIERFMKDHYRLAHVEHFDWLEVDEYEVR